VIIRRKARLRDEFISPRFSSTSPPVGGVNGRLFTHRNAAIRWRVEEIYSRGDEMKAATTRGHLEPINGMEMYYEIRGEGEPLILLHGGGGVGANWELIFKEAPEGFQLVIPDLRGHGRSTNPSMEITFRQLALDVFALMDRLGIERFKAVGLSLGAKTLLHVATQQPERIEAMVVVSATPYFPPQARALMRELTPDNRSEAEWQQMREWHKRGDEQIRAIWKQMNALKDSYTDMNFTPPYLSTITARTLIVHGDRDPLYPVEIAMEMRSAIPRSYLWVVPNGGHGPIFGDRAASFVETAMAFLRSHWAAQ
jgi:pimeloyl-ACP methyl ester carboxylesterase